MQRYSRQIILPDFGEAAQEKLLQSRVLVVGAGGLGCPALQYLTAAGVGTIGIADGDIIDLSNLHRQVLFGEGDIGKKKASVAKQKLQLLNSDVHLIEYPFHLEPSNIFEIISEYEIVVDCTDNFSIRYLLNDVCALLQKPLVFASIFQYEAQLSVFHYGIQPTNLRNLFAEIPDKNAVPNCAEAGVLGVLAGIIGNLQANEVIKILTGIGKVNAGKLMLYNSKDNSIEQITITKSDKIFIPRNKEDILNQHYQFACPVYEIIAEKDKLKTVLNYENAVLLDVRNEDELPAITSFQSMRIPLSQLLSSFDSLMKYKHIVCICQSGIRSAKAIEQLQDQFPEKLYYQVKGGITIFN